MLEGFPPGEYDEIVHHAYIVTEPEEIKKLSHNYFKIDHNHACGYTHNIEFWSDRNTLLEASFFNENISCGGRSLTELVGKLEKNPTHYIYEIEVPTDVTIQELNTDLMKNDILAFIDLEHLKHLPSIVVYYNVYFSPDNNISLKEQLNSGSNLIDKYINKVESDLVIESSDSTRCSYFLTEEGEGCISRIIFRVGITQDLKEAEEYFNETVEIESVTINNFESYTVCIFHTSDDIEKVKNELMDKLGYIQEVKIRSID